MSERWKTRLLIGAVTLFLASTAWNVATRISAQTKTVTSIDRVIEVIEEDCLKEGERNRQIKVRGEAEKTLLELFLTLAHQSVTEGKDATGVSQDFIERFGPLTKRIRILPLPDCHKQADQLRDELPPG
jgi:hypothetical protein